MNQQYTKGNYDWCRLQWIFLNHNYPSYGTSGNYVLFDMKRPEGEMMYTAFDNTIRFNIVCNCAQNTSIERREKIVPKPDIRY